MRLNKQEQKLLDELRLRMEPAQTKDLGKSCYRGIPIERAHSWARNSMRRLVALGLAESPARGLYEAKEWR